MRDRQKIETLGETFLAFGLIDRYQCFLDAVVFQDRLFIFNPATSQIEHISGYYGDADLTDAEAEWAFDVLIEWRRNHGEPPLMRELAEVMKLPRLEVSRAVNRLLEVGRIAGKGTGRRWMRIISK